MEGNLTRGPILKTLTKLAIPIMASSFLGTLYNITDMAWIGLLGSGNCQRDHAAGNFRAEEGKCAEKTPFVCKNSAGICGENL